MYVVRTLNGCWGITIINSVVTNVHGVKSFHYTPTTWFKSLREEIIEETTRNTWSKCLLDPVWGHFKLFGGLKLVDCLILEKWMALQLRGCITFTIINASKSGAGGKQKCVGKLYFVKSIQSFCCTFSWVRWEICSLLIPRNQRKRSPNVAAMLILLWGSQSSK